MGKAKNFLKKSLIILAAGVFLTAFAALFSFIFGEKSVEVLVENSEAGLPLSDVCVIREKPRRFYEFIFNPVGSAYFPHENPERQTTGADGKCIFSGGRRYTGAPVNNPESIFVYTRNKNITVKIKNGPTVSAQGNKPAAAWCF